MKGAKGFTVVELLIGITVLIILAALIVSSFSEFRKNQTLNNTANEIVVLINEARSNTLSSKDFSQYGVHFETARIVFFKGTTFTEPDPDNVEITLSSLVEISSISLNGGGSDLVFQKITGKTDEFGQVTLRLKADITKTKIIDINLTGIIDVQ